MRSREDQLRHYRSSASVSLGGYLRVRRDGVITCIFEGKECPAFYNSKIKQVKNWIKFNQFIPGGKDAVLLLRKSIMDNLSAKNDKVIYFVDNDFDDYPRMGQYNDVYVTRGYSIENEYVEWDAVESFIRATFYIANDDDHNAIESLKKIYKKMFDAYINATYLLNKALYICHVESIRCIAGDDCKRLIDINFDSQEVSIRKTLGEICDELKIDETGKEKITNNITRYTEFESINKTMGWRGKYHFWFLRIMMKNFSCLRRSGKAPFNSSCKILGDISQPNLIVDMSSYVSTPPCLKEFLETSL